MKLKENFRWAAIALGILGGSTSALACVVTPDSILTEGQTLQLVADCGADRVGTINWRMSTTEGGTATTITGDITLNQAAPKKIYYTIPAELTNSGAGEYWFSVTGTSVGGAPDDITTADKAKVIVKPASAVLAVANTTNPAINGACGTPPGTALQNMPTGSAQCSAGKAALAISGPSSFTWSCLGLNGGTEANCYGVRGYTVTTQAGANGTVSASQGVAAGGTATITAFPNTGYSVSSFTGTTCPGTPSGDTYAAGPITDNCIVKANFTNTPLPGACGSESASLTQPGQCTAGAFAEVADTADAFKWNCVGTGSTDYCSAPKQYTVNATLSGTGGTVNLPTSKTVTHNASTTFSVTPDGTNVASASGSAGCSSASASGTTVSTGTVTGACTVTVTFGPPNTTEDPGTGSWKPSATRLIADQSGTANTTYAVGCLNGGEPTSSSSSGCALNTTFDGFAMGSGNVLGVRYTSKAALSTAVRYVRINSGDGGNLGQTMKAWLSTDPLSTYDGTTAKCRWASSTTLYATTAASGTTYCVIQPNTQYYLLMSVDAAPAGYRYKLDELSADFD